MGRCHPTGSIQPHSALIVPGEPDLKILHVSGSVDKFFGVPADVLLGRHASILGGDLVDRISALAREGSLTIPYPTKCVVSPRRSFPSRSQVRAPCARYG